MTPIIQTGVVYNRLIIRSSTGVWHFVGQAQTIGEREYFTSDSTSEGFSFIYTSSDLALDYCFSIDEGTITPSPLSLPTDTGDVVHFTTTTIAHITDFTYLNVVSTLTDFISPDFKAPCELEIDLISTYFEEEVDYLVHEGLKEESYENLF